MSAGSAAADVTGLLKRVQRLELAARRNAGGLMIGDYQTAIRGQGMVFHETRKYVAGDPVRLIDWNATARVGEPYVKVHLEERQREVVIALDVSPSMHAGFQDKTKLETAVELAATLAVSTVEGGDRLGWVVFADQALAEHRPRGGRTQLFRALRSFLDHTSPWTRPVSASDPRLGPRSLLPPQTPAIARVSSSRRNGSGSPGDQSCCADATRTLSCTLQEDA